MLDADAIHKLRLHFAKVCKDFEAKLVGMHAEDDHVHLLVNDPPKVAVSNWVNSLKGVFNCLLHSQLTWTGLAAHWVKL